RLTEEIDGLPVGYRTVFVMHDVEGYTHEEIGATLGIETGTSKAQLSRARAKLRDSLADFQGGGVSLWTIGSRSGCATQRGTITAPPRATRRAKRCGMPSRHGAPRADAG